MEYKDGAWNGQLWPMKLFKNGPKAETEIRKRIRIAAAKLLFIFNRNNISSQIYIVDLYE